ncbi:MAG TPA: hypothetical protein VLL05_07770 [Terriglobales bacterium]|nr:hypothetical protein [Terriglobales bacterium]
MRYALSALLVLILLTRPSHAGKEYSCNMAAFTAEDLEQYKQLSQSLHASVQEKKELRNGYAFKLPATTLVSASRWVSYERLCCPFFDFAIEAPRDSGPLWLRISGDKGVKEFVRAEFDL